MIHSSYSTAIQTACHALLHGDVLAYPTEAVWGLGCDPFQRDAFEKLLHLKQRPIEKGVILLAGDIQQVDFLLKPLSKARYQAIIQSWTTLENEQATTWLFPHSTDIPHWIIGQHDKVAVRVTQHPLCKQLCQAFGGFIVSTSANPAGLAPAITQQQAFQYFQQQVCYLSGEVGHFHRPSRIIDACTGEILRA